MERPIANSYWVLPGSLLAGEHPDGPEDVHVRVRVQRLLNAGIDYFVDLTEPGERADYHMFLPPQVGYLRSAIADASVPGHVAQMQDIQARIHGALTRGRRVYVHCRAGIGRTGLTVGCYLAEQGLKGPAALKALNRLWQQSERSVSWRRVPQTPEQRRYILRWPRHRQQPR
jgi:hypothetical protein